jgi:hypothetical protein
MVKKAKEAARLVKKSFAQIQYVTASQQSQAQKLDTQKYY